MKKTTIIIVLFIAAILAGLFVRYLSPAAVKRTEKMENEGEGEEESGEEEGVKEGFAQREVGMPLEMQSVTGSVGVAGFNGTPPLLGSEPKPVSEKPYDMANDNELFQFENNKMSADCCPSPFSGDRGCVCLTEKQVSDFASRGGNRNMSE
jgi:hypothetical protein